MTVTIVGSQLGDEGKGAVVDLFGEAADVVARYQGGDNAGHTVVHEGEEYKLSLVPSGAVRGKVGVLGNGCVVNPATLFDEIDALREQGIDPDVRVAERAHVILPYHRVLDGLEEEAKSDSELEAGTTGRGIGPTYEDKAARRGLRVADLLDADRLRSKLEYVVPHKRAVAAEVFGIDPGEAFDVDALHEEYADYGRRLREGTMTVNASKFLADRRAEDENVMLEGAQGTLIDIDHGDYPQVTSSNPTAGGACTGTGLGPGVVGDGERIGVVKAYLTRVGSGPLPTELAGVEGDTPGYDGAADPEEEELATYIREEGGEYGTVTGRPRRVGWLDVPMLRHAARVSGFTGVVVNHVDVLAGLDEVKVGHSYVVDGEETLTVPTATEAWADCEVTYRTFDGWPAFDTATLDAYADLPANARDYLEYLEAELDTDVYAVGVGPDRAETVVRQHPW